MLRRLVRMIIETTLSIFFIIAFFYLLFNLERTNLLQSFFKLNGNIG